MRECIIIAFAYIAAVIGAGFASGAEVVSFFLVYGKESIWGLLVSGVLFGGFSYFVLRDCIEYGISDFSEYLKFIMPPFWKKISDFVVFVFMIITLAAMAAAAGGLLNDIFLLPEFLGAVLFSVVISVILNFSVSKLARLNAILGIIIAFGIVLSSIYVINFRFLETFNGWGKITASAIAYTTYNGVSSAVILCSMSRLLNTKKQAFKASILTGLGIFIILACLWCVVGIYYGKVDLGEIPMLAVAKRQGSVFYFMYSLILFFAVLTTAVSNGFGVAEYIKKIASSRITVLLVLVLMIFLSRIGFGVIVDVAYRICGYISLIIPLFIIINRVKRRKS